MSSETTDPGNTVKHIWERLKAHAEAARAHERAIEEKTDAAIGHAQAALGELKRMRHTAVVLTLALIAAGVVLVKC